MNSKGELLKGDKIVLAGSGAGLTWERQFLPGSIKGLQTIDGVDMELGKALNTLLVKLFRDIMDIEEKTLITGEFTDITINERVKGWYCFH